MNKKLKAFLQKINFQVGRTPTIEKCKDWRKYIPEPYKSVLIITADFELAWAWRYTKSSPNPFETALDKARLERKNIPNILALCEEFNIPITWLTVGHLFLEGCSKINGVPHSNIPRLNKFENDWWKYDGEDWFEYDPCSSFKEAPEWYCPDLIEQILNSKVKHEIGCHTFSHIDCRDVVCSPEVFQAELAACKEAAERFGLRDMKSFVHPGHTIGNLDILTKQGFTNFRSNDRNVLGYPLKRSNGLWEYEQTAEFLYKKEWSVNYHIYRFKKIVDRSIATNTVCYFWFHPSFASIIVEEIFPKLFEYISSKKEILLTINSGEYIELLNSLNE